MNNQSENKSTLNLYNEIVENLRKYKQLSQILPSILILSKKLKNKELEKWTELEMNSYFGSNNALTKEVIVPEYRAVAGQYYDIYKRPLVITDPKLQFINEYRLRYAVSELEKLEQSNKFLTIQDTTFTDLIKKKLNVDVHQFSFSSTSITGILESLRTKLINTLIDMEQEIAKSIPESEKGHEHTNLQQALENLHPIILNVAKQLYLDGYYRQAILDTYIQLVDTVKTKSGRYDLDGTPLMQTVFSPRKPIIKISDDPDEQQGFMWMFSGSVMGIRNPKAHKLIQQRNPQRTLEWLSFASVLLRVLDDSEVIKYE